jgi:hypothetical protein
MFVLCVDDLILIGNKTKLPTHVKLSLKKKYGMTNLVHLYYFLGLPVLQIKEGISLSQPKYARDILRCFHMDDYKPMPSPF